MHGTVVSFHMLSISLHNVSKGVLWFILQQPWLKSSCTHADLHFPVHLSLGRYFRLISTIHVFNRSLNVLSMPSSPSFSNYSVCTTHSLALLSFSLKLGPGTTGNNSQCRGPAGVAQKCSSRRVVDAIEAAAWLRRDTARVMKHTLPCCKISSLERGEAGVMTIQENLMWTLWFAKC